jgi:oligopeptidase B
MRASEIALFILLTMTQLSAADRAPVAKQIPKKMTLFGDTRVDNYYWLRDKKNPETIAYLEAENTYTQKTMLHTEELQGKLYKEILGRIQQADETVPVKIDDYYYYRRTLEGKQYSLYCRKHNSLQAPEEVLLDGNQMAEGHPYFSIGSWLTSPDHSLLAYAADYTGDEIYTIYVKDLRSGQLLPDRMLRTSDGFVWASDNKTIVYATLDKAQRPFKVYRHSLGGKRDTLLHHEKDERFTVDVSKTSSRMFIVLQISSSLTSEVRVLRADAPRGPLEIVLPRVQGVEYDVTHHGDSFFIRTNDHAQTFRVMEAPIHGASRENWKEVIAARPDVTIESVRAFANHLVAEERERGLVKLRVRDFRTNEDDVVGFEEPAYAAELGVNGEYDTPIVRYTYTSLVVPLSTYDYNMETHERLLKKREPVLGGYDPDQYATERLYAKASDGAEIPISLVYKKGFVRDGRAPMLLYGYGSYGISIDPSFRADRLSLLNRGMVFAIAHIRGGGDLGKPWHESGRLLTKRNTFTDFIAAAEHLVAQKYTSPDRLAINGRSAGGLLMGAVTNMRPDLFAVVVAQVPFVDALTTELDTTLPLTVGEWEEWGNPNEKQYYDYIKSYSPLDNVTAQAYPAMLITGGLNDPRVMYWEPTKWAAKLRALRTNDKRLLLKTEMGSGHFGSSGRFDYLKETAFYFTFILDTLGIPE